MNRKVLKDKWWFFGVITVFAIVLVFSIFPTRRKVVLAGKTVKVEIADTQKEREKGLMWRKYLPQNEGMLFVFNHPAPYSFWMKNTLIPLDIIWISNNRIVDLTTLYPSQSETPQYTPRQEASYVLEINAGFIKNNNVKIGDEIKIK